MGSRGGFLTLQSEVLPDGCTSERRHTKFRLPSPGHLTLQYVIAKFAFSHLYHLDVTFRFPGQFSSIQLGCLITLSTHFPIMVKHLGAQSH